MVKKRPARMPVPASLTAAGHPAQARVLAFCEPALAILRELCRAAAFSWRVFDVCPGRVTLLEIWQSEVVDRLGLTSDQFLAIVDQLEADGAVVRDSIERRRVYPSPQARGRP
jgi:hypothetical protein